MVLPFNYSVVSDSLQPHGLPPARLLCPWDFPGKNIREGCHFLLQRIFLTQESNPHLLYFLHWRWILYHWATLYGKWNVIQQFLKLIIDNSTYNMGESGNNILTERNQTWNYVSTRILWKSTWNFHKRQIYRDIRKISNCLGLEGKWEVGDERIIQWYRVSSQWKYSKINYGDGCTILQVDKAIGCII